jgi:hypothetical protein
MQVVVTVVEVAAMLAAHVGGVVVRVIDAHLPGVRQRDSSHPSGSRCAAGGGIELLCLHQIRRPVSCLPQIERCRRGRTL